MKILIALCSLILTLVARAETKSLYDIPLKDIDGKEASLKPFQGKVVLVVNVASKCGLTPQYKQLEEVYQKYKAQGLVVAGFPCNQFGKQEPGTNTEIKEFCSSKYHATFPMFDKLEVNGANRHALYKSLIGEGGKDIGWNFGKFIVGRDGKVLLRIEPRTKPDAPEVVKAIEAALAAK
ncbi:MAG: glutathione peroxidase [Pedosphaera sp.]|nr:glutathione peroxidase [Pedosphaera sp.]MSU27814.1 glutathione peroxidase [Pedosphaera sp.]